jgi:hypothetical protein
MEEAGGASATLAEDLISTLFSTFFERHAAPVETFPSGQNPSGTAKKALFFVPARL